MTPLSTNTNMATRNAAGLPGRPEKSTDFQLHSGRGSSKNVIDFTEHKLIQHASKVLDQQQKLHILALVDDYRNGLVAIAWKRGAPIYFKVTKDN